MAHYREQVLKLIDAALSAPHDPYLAAARLATASEILDQASREAELCAALLEAQRVKKAS